MRSSARNSSSSRSSSFVRRHNRSNCALLALSAARLKTLPPRWCAVPDPGRDSDGASAGSRDICCCNCSRASTSGGGTTTSDSDRCASAMAVTDADAAEDSGGSVAIDAADGATADSVDVVPPGSPDALSTPSEAAGADALPVPPSTTTTTAAVSTTAAAAAGGGGGIPPPPHSLFLANSRATTPSALCRISASPTS